jgi:hypothetical protein
MNGWIYCIDVIHALNFLGQWVALIEWLVIDRAVMSGPQAIAIHLSQ